MARNVFAWLTVPITTPSNRGTRVMHAGDGWLERDTFVVKRTLYVVSKTFRVYSVTAEDVRGRLASLIAVQFNWTGAYFLGDIGNACWRIQGENKLQAGNECGRVWAGYEGQDRGSEGNDVYGVWCDGKRCVW